MKIRRIDENPGHAPYGRAPRRLTARVATMAACAVAIALQIPSAPGTNGTPPRPPASPESESGPAVVEPIPGSDDHSAILHMVRRHRAGADDAWSRSIADAIHEESVAASVDPLLVAAIVARESSFRPAATSHAGAVGLMQLRPFVARSVAREAELPWAGKETLSEPRLNVRLGILYYKELVERFRGDERIALAAYNRGPTRVSSQLRRGTYAGSSYADRVLQTYQELRREV